MAMEINGANSGVVSQIMDLKTSTPGVTRKEEIKTEFKNTNEYSKYLQEKYSYMNTGTTSMQGVPVTVSVSGAFLKKCMDNPEKAAYLECYSRVYQAFCRIHENNARKSCYDLL